MTIDTATPNRNYPLPSGGNNLSHDVSRLIAALQAVDVDVAAVLTALVQKAPLLNAPLAGAPTAPTPGSTDNSTRIATTQWVRANFADFIGAAPAALDTIAELAAALQNNPNVITELTAMVGGKLAQSQNLNDLADKPTARTNLNVYSKSETDLRVAAATHAAPSKATPVDADEVTIYDSATGLLARLTWANLKAAIKTYIQSAALAIAGNLSATGSITQGAAANASGQITLGNTAIEIGTGRTADGFAYIDITSTVGADFNFRIMRASGANGAIGLSNTGTGSFDLSGGGNLTWNGTRIPTITVSTAAPSGGVNGDLWFQV
ncbi:hypothetical protein [Mesorhizobium sp.]|uniref:hypothetical protein n=1 Tax=Mesorhizobium sp. TaxID=1871066 RepID=UPI00121A33B0|nr:hypothetical protein [Mesorhizobium sp.]TIV59972.1 MAG: hypothetical protein E5V80_11555 [Mesorhizobium sp.]